MLHVATVLKKRNKKCFSNKRKTYQKEHINWGSRWS